jgi:O-antigen ligase
VAAFSLLLSAAILGPQKVLIGSLYLLRFAAYCFFFVLVWRTRNKKRLINALLVVGVAIALFGWIQYLWFPDLRSFVVWGWDDHLYRLTSTFLDPAFTGILLVFALILAFSQKYYLIAGFLLITLGFTYSRASFLALLVVLPFLVGKFKKVLLFVLTLLVLVFALPRPGGEGVKLERLHSLFLKFENYQESVEIVKQNPLFGIGFNNLCLARNGSLESHACSGLDNSFLFVLATTGIVGLISFLDLLIGLVKTTTKSYVGKLFWASGLALLVHAQFTNTLFYPWVMGWVAILAGVSREKSGR